MFQKNLISLCYLVIAFVLLNLSNTGSTAVSASPQNKKPYPKPTVPPTTCPTATTTITSTTVTTATTTLTLPPITTTETAITTSTTTEIPTPVTTTETTTATLTSTTTEIPTPVTTTETTTSTTTETATTTTTETTTSSTTVTATTTVTAPATCPTETQVIRNPSFESGSDWTYLPTIPNDIIRGSPGPTNPAYDGTMLIQFAIDRKRAYPDGPKLLQPFSICPGARYKLSFALRTIAASSSVRPSTVTAVVNGAIVVQSTPLTPEQGWVVFEGIWTATGAGDAFVMVTASNEFDGTAGTGPWSYLWFDQISLTKI
ncbi:hypothetical protein HK104_003121 [Borealophlyctis nickersoniae]|nr:hypothetical protein HK104_003121 [Borealophlyctis nickersoniae]